MEWVVTHILSIELTSVNNYSPRIQGQLKRVAVLGLQFLKGRLLVFVLCSAGHLFRDSRIGDSAFHR